MRVFTFCLPLLFLFAAPGRAFEFPPSPAGNKAGIAFKGGTFDDTTFEDVPYVTSDLVDSLFGGVPRWVPRAQQLHLRDKKGREWVFTLDNPFVAIGGEMFNLTYPVRRNADGLYLPLHPLRRLLRAKFGFDLLLQQPENLKDIVPSAANGNITGIEIEERKNGTLLKIHALGNLKWEGLLAPPHYLLKLENGKLASSCSPPNGKGLVQSVTTLQEKGLAQLTLRLREGYDTVEVFRDSSLPGLLVNVRRKPPASEKTEPPPPTRTEKKGSGTIIVDAGHGGHDRGAVVRGVEEATVTLAVAGELKKALVSMGYKVRLTREDDTYKTLVERPKFASTNGGDVFVSLHCNSLGGPANKRRDVTGHTVYILREGESEEDKALARRENQAIHEENGKTGKTEIAPVDWILLEHQLNLYSKQSESLAESIVKNFSGFDIPKYSTGARQAGFFVLVGAYMPAVLFEMGFLTNTKDRRILSSKSGQREIARRMAIAIDKFRRNGSP